MIGLRILKSNNLSLFTRVHLVTLWTSIQVTRFVVVGPGHAENDPFPLREVGKTHGLIDFCVYFLFFFLKSARTHFHSDNAFPLFLFFSPLRSCHWKAIGFFLRDTKICGRCTSCVPPNVTEIADGIQSIQRVFSGTLFYRLITESVWNFSWNYFYSFLFFVLFFFSFKFPRWKMLFAKQKNGSLISRWRSLRLWLRPFLFSGEKKKNWNVQEAFSNVFFLLPLPTSLKFEKH